MTQPTTTRRRLLAGGAVAALTSLAGCSGLTPFVGKREEEIRTVPIEDANALTVTADLGDVTVRATDRNDVRARLVKQASSVTADISKLRFRVKRAGSELRLRSEWTGGDSLLGGTPSMDVELDVPRSLAVPRAETAVGDVTVTDVAGDTAAQSRTGDVRVERVDGAVMASSRTGDVHVRDPSVLGGANTRTGDVVVDIPAIDGETRITSRTGDVEAALSTDLDADLTAQSEVGDVSAQGLDLADDVRSETLVTGTLGDGGAALTLETETGDVVLTALD